MKLIIIEIIKIYSTYIHSRAINSVPKKNRLITYIYLLND